MNRTKIEWVKQADGTDGFTWNPIVGCTNNCSYCYARRQAKRQKPIFSKYRRGHVLRGCQLCYDFTPHLHEERLEQPLKRKKPATIFLGSMCDLWDMNVPLAWRQQIWEVVKQTPQHIYLVLTKQPDNILPIPLAGLSNLWIGCSVCVATDASRVYRLFRATPQDIWDRLFVSYEPLLGSVNNPKWGQRYAKWFIIGSQTGSQACQPEAAWVEEILDIAAPVGRAEIVDPRLYCHRFSNRPVFAKDNLDWPEELGPKPRELPYLPEEDTNA